MTEDGLYGPLLHDAQRPVGEVHSIAFVPVPTRRLQTEGRSVKGTVLMSGLVERLDVLVGKILWKLVYDYIIKDH